MSLHLRRSDDGLADAVVGEIEQSAQIILVAGDALFHERVAIGRRRRLLQHEAALRAHRDDHDVLHLLRLDEAQHLGAEILGPIRPAQPAARDLAESKVHALEPRRVDEDLEHRLRLGQPRHLRRVELERQVGARPALVVATPEVGARRREDQHQVLAQHAVLGQVLDAIERVVDLLDLAHRLCAARRPAARDRSAT